MAFHRKNPAAIGIKVPFPGFVEPALATSIEKVPSGARWVHDIKFDGYRVQLHIANEDIKVFSPIALDRNFAKPRLRCHCSGLQTSRRAKSSDTSGAPKG